MKVLTYFNQTPAGVVTCGRHKSSKLLWGYVGGLEAPLWGGLQEGHQLPLRFATSFLRGHAWGGDVRCLCWGVLWGQNPACMGLYIGGGVMTLYTYSNKCESG